MKHKLTSFSYLLIFIFTSLIAVSFSLVICLKLGDSFSKIMAGVDYRKLSIAVILMQILILYIFVFYYGSQVFFIAFLLVTSTDLGIVPHYLGVGKSNLMGVLIIPAITIYFLMFH